MPDVASWQAPEEAVGTWRLMPEQSSVRFAEKHFWGLITVRGNFDVVNGEADVDKAGQLRASVGLDAGSVATGNAKRDEHLRGPDFFDAGSCPTIDIESLGITLLPGDDVLQVSATVSAAGRSLPIEFAVTLDRSEPGSAGARGSVTIDRRDLGMRWSPLRMATCKVTVDFDLRFAQQASSEPVAEA
jgi:polyisoprenoid-binding protein YceI